MFHSCFALIALWFIFVPDPGVALCPAPEFACGEHGAGQAYPRLPTCKPFRRRRTSLRLAACFMSSGATPNRRFIQPGFGSSHHGGELPKWWCFSRGMVAFWGQMSASPLPSDGSRSSWSEEYLTWWGRSTGTRRVIYRALDSFVALWGSGRCPAIGFRFANPEILRPFPCRVWESAVRWPNPVEGYI